MSKRKTIQMLVAMLLSIIMAGSMTPVSALAVDESEEKISALAEAGTTLLPTGGAENIEVTGAGTQADPLQIESAEQLAAFAWAVNNGLLPKSLPEKPFLILMDDIDLSDYNEEDSEEEGWAPIGRFNVDYWYVDDSPKDLYAFKGTFDGNGKKITGLYINREEMGEIGLFGYVYGGTIKNVTVENGNVTGWYRVGGIVGYVENSFIDNCSFSGSVTGVSFEGSSDDIGGIAGLLLRSSIQDCKNTGDIIGDAFSSGVGGIAGEINMYWDDDIDDYSMRNCINEGTVTGGTYTGGVIGTSSVWLEGCVNTGSVRGISEIVGDFSGYIGGIAGFQGYNMLNCVNTGNVTGMADKVGGMAGIVYEGTIQNCYNGGAISGVGGDVGGMAGKVNGAIIQSCVNNGPVSGGANNIGGLAGSLDGATIRNCINYADISVHESAIAINVAGVAGYVQGRSLVTNCLTTGDVSGTVAGEVMRGGISSVVGMIDDENQDEFSPVSFCVALGQFVKKSGGCGNVSRLAYRDDISYERETYLNYAWTDMEVYWDDDDLIPKEDFWIYRDGFDADVDILYKLWTDTEPYTELDWEPGIEPDLETIARVCARLLTESWRDAGVWTLADGRLPVLTGMPDGTVQYEDFPDYISGVTGVVLSPDSASVKKGSTKAFTATVEGINVVDDIVTWSVSGNKHEDTTIDSSGVLTVARDETAKSLTVTAVYDVDPSKSATATVTVTSTAAPYIPGPSGGGSSSSGSSPATVSIGGGVTESVDVTTSNGSSSAKLTSGISSYLANGQAVTISFPEADGVTEYSLSLPAAGLTAEGDSQLSIVTGAGSVSLPSDMLTGIAASSGGTATFKISGVDVFQLPEDAREAVGARPVVSLSISIDGEPIRWNNPGAPVTVRVPYTPSNGEDTNAIVVWYIDGAGNLSCVTNGRYDAETGTVSFTTTHFSHYAVGYNKVSFADVPDGSWCFDAVTYLAARGITKGTGSDTFSPDAYLTRSDFITLLMRAYGIEADEAYSDNFTDAGSTYYTGYLAAAKRLGISDGVGDNKFAPEQFITRQETFTLMYRTLNLLEKLPKETSDKSLQSFSDSGDIEPFARDAVDYLVKAGAINGSDSMLNPKAVTTRAQMAQLIYNLLSRL